ncbi:MAG: two-component system response regulator CreB [Methylococcales bacterium]
MDIKILIIEDEPSIVDNISFALETEGFVAKWCATGEDALIEIETGGYDLIILDIGLPDISGLELAKCIRNQSEVPIIFLTARSSEIDRVVGLELGADDYVTKPFSPRELSARVKAVLRRTKSNIAVPIVANHQNSVLFEIDDVRLQISYRNQTLVLSRTEYRLLKLLVESPGRVYSRDQLMHHAWEYSGISLERTVDTHIKTIRQKLKAVHPNDDSIVTHRGIGYALRDNE